MTTAGGCVYILANRKNGALYTGVTSNLSRRVHEHRVGATPGFATRYGIKRLIWFEQHGDIATAIHRETQIKRWNRSWKIALIEKENPDWDDLAVKLLGFAPLRAAVSTASVEVSGDGFPLSRE
jgi:putative endonuclease